ncbi:MAG: polymer-forming cytoskeletal protein [Nitrospirae bacterium]|nr:polymer-forming cytoskeletal protein [Nitrospirota bacterium]
MKLLTFLKEIVKGFFSRTDNFEVLIGAGSESKGEIRAAGTVKIEGRHIGTVTANQIIILEKACVRGDMRSGAVIVAGTAEGDITADELVEVRGTGRISGDIYSQRLSVSEGGIFNGYARIYKNTATKIDALVDSKAAMT